MTTQPTILKLRNELMAKLSKMKAEYEHPKVLAAIDQSFVLVGETWVTKKAELFLRTVELVLEALTERRKYMEDIDIKAFEILRANTYLRCYTDLNQVKRKGCYGQICKQMIANHDEGTYTSAEDIIAAMKQAKEKGRQLAKATEKSKKAAAKKNQPPTPKKSRKAVEVFESDGEEETEEAEGSGEESD
jgi:hypothetical protein